MKDEMTQDFKENPFLDFSYVYLFPPTMRYIGILMMFSSPMICFESVVVSILVGSLGAWFAFRKSGVQLQPLNKLRREYTSFLLKKGKGYSYEEYPYMAVLSGREGYAAYSRTMVEQKITEEVFDIFLLSKDHRKRLIVARGNDRNDAVGKGQRLARTIGLEWTTYNPKVSDKTRARRR